MARRSGCWPSKKRHRREALESLLDVRGEETQGMIGYLLEEELGNRVSLDKPLASLRLQARPNVGGRRAVIDKDRVSALPARDTMCCRSPKSKPSPICSMR